MQGGEVAPTDCRSLLMPNAAEELPSSCTHSCCSHKKLLSLLAACSLARRRAAARSALLWAGRGASHLETCLPAFCGRHFNAELLQGLAAGPINQTRCGAQVRGEARAGRPTTDPCTSGGRPAAGSHSCPRKQAIEGSSMPAALRMPCPASLLGALQIVGSSSKRTTFVFTWSACWGRRPSRRPKNVRLPRRHPALRAQHP